MIDQLTFAGAEVELYEKAKWKFDKMLADEIEYGCFYLSTLLGKNIPKVFGSDYMSCRIQIEYNGPQENWDEMEVFKSCGKGRKSLL